ncbi:hypothetical protein F5Y09DRAFT_352128 [Xylaria sp. FL1042]|nr:hypothetical protein F5Y09DRAFT_352128 [Xylaria sp. FL1042]
MKMVERRAPSQLLLVFVGLLSLPIYQAIGESLGVRPFMTTGIALFMASLLVFVNSLCFSNTTVVIM